MRTLKIFVHKRIFEYYNAECLIVHMIDFDYQVNRIVYRNGKNNISIENPVVRNSREYVYDNIHYTYTYA